MSEEDVRKAVEPLILEYFENSDSMEVLFTLQEMLPNLGKCKNEIHITNIQKPYFQETCISIHEKYVDFTEKNNCTNTIILGTRRWMVVTITVELAMDHKPSHRELASVLISDLYQKVISQRDIGKGM